MKNKTPFEVALEIADKRYGGCFNLISMGNAWRFGFGLLGESGCDVEEAIKRLHAGNTRYEAITNAILAEVREML